MSAALKGAERNAKVLAMRRAGRTLRSIGAELGFTDEAVRQMAIRAERLEQEMLLYSEKPLLMLSVRARNCLIAEFRIVCPTANIAFPPPALVREWHDAGKLEGIPNMGKKSVQEVAAWLSAIGA